MRLALSRASPQAKSRSAANSSAHKRTTADKAPFDKNPNKIIVISGDQDQGDASVAVVSAGFLEHTTTFPVNGMQIDKAFGPNILIEKRPISRITSTGMLRSSIIDNNPANKIVINDDNNVASTTWNGAELAGNIGAMFGPSSAPISAAIRWRRSLPAAP